MTGFLGERNFVGARDFAQGGEAWKGPQTGLWESLGARADVTAIEEEYWDLNDRRMMETIGPISERLYGNAAAFMIPPDIRARGVLNRSAITMEFNEAVDLLFADLNSARVADPDAWRDAPKDRAEVEAQLRTELSKELKDAQSVVARDRNLPYFPDQTLKDFAAGGFIGATQPEALPLLALSPGGSLARRVAGEAVLGVLGEVATRPRIEAQADFLDIKAPDFWTSAAVAGAFGGALPLAGAAISRGARLATAEGRAEAFGGWRNQAATPEEAAALTQAEDAIRAGDPSAAPTTPPPKPQATDDWIDAIIMQESINGQMLKGPDLENPDGTIENAWGLMHVRPSTARAPGFKIQGMTGTDEEIIAQLLDPAKNREFGTAYFQAMLNKYEDVDTALMAYNMGPGATDKWIAAGRRYADLPKQTRDYVVAVRRHRSAQGKAAPSGPVDFDALAARPAVTNGQGVILPPTMRTPAGSRIDVEYEIVDLARLRAAEGDLQPRDRTRAGSREQIAQIAADLDPELLMPSPVMSHGAPLIGPDDIVESGNGRIAAIRAAAESPETGRYAAYLDALRDAGFELPATGQPVLVARRRTELDEAGRRALVAEANATPVMRFSPTEQALADAEALPMNALAQFDSGAQIFSSEGRLFVQSMFARMPQSERAGLYTAEGGLNAAGRQRIEAAIFARAYEAPDLIGALTETPDAASAGLVRALTEAAPQWASLRQGIEAGEIHPSFDLTPDLVGAVRTIAQARRDAAVQKRPVATLLDEAMRQSDFERGAPSAAQRMLVEAFYDGGRARAADQAAAILKSHVEAARRHGSGEPDLFGARPPPAVLDGLERGARRAEGEAPAARSEAEPLPAPQEGLGDLTQPPPRAEPGSMEELKSLVARGAPAEELEAHPAVRRALAEMDAIPRTDLAEGFGSPEWRAARRYQAGGREVDFDGAVAHLEAAARSLAWTDEGLAPPANPTRAERRAFIVIGPPAAGKSTIANPLARKWGAAIVDADEAKKIIPEYQRGVGANAVHEESGDLAQDVYDRLAKSGANIVLPKVGGSLASIERQIRDLKTFGYHVSLVNMRVPAEEAYRRMFGRFVNTGRMINPAYVREVGDKPNATYLTLKEGGGADEFAQIDNSGSFGDPKPIDDPAGLFEGSGLRTASSQEPADLRGDGGGGNAQLGASGAAPRGTPGAAEVPRDLTSPPRATPTPEAVLRQPEALTRYSDPESAEAVATAEAHMRELREQALADPEFAALELTDEAGGVLRGADGEPMTVARMLADLDADEALAKTVQTCGRTK